MHLRVEKAFKSKRKPEIKEVYTASFSTEDQMPFVMMLILSCLWHTGFPAFYDGNALCSFLYTATIRNVTFVLFFAVAGNLRSKGYGGAILNKMHSNNKSIPFIKPCDKGVKDNEERLRRKKFYMNNGYSETGYFIKLGKKQEIPIKNGVFNARKFRLFFMLYGNLTIIPSIPSIWDIRN